MKALAIALQRFLLPNGCVVCDRAVEPARPDGLICGVCRTRMRPLGAGCARCGQPLPPVGPCRFCSGWAGLAFARSAVWLNDAARPVVHHLKYDALPTLAADIAELIDRHLARPGPAVLVPIPLSAHRLRTRGYNQAAVIAHALGRVWEMPVAERLLSRTRDTGTQTALTPEARARNVAGAFVARPAPTDPAHPAHPAHPGERQGGAIILIDDVLTTGATLVAAATALGAAGWGAVGAVTFARALPYELRAAAG